MKAVTYIVCLLTMLLNIVAPANTTSWNINEALPASGLHFEQDRDDFLKSIAEFHFVATDETNDSADSENEPIEPASLTGTPTCLSWLAHHSSRALNGKNHSLFAKSHAPFIGSALPLYLRQRVLRL